MKTHVEQGDNWLRPTRNAAPTLQVGLTAKEFRSILYRMKSIIAMFPSAAALAREIGKNPITVRQWGNRGSIPGKYDVPILSAAKRLNVPLTLEMLAEARSPGKSGNPDEKQAFAGNRR